jgi:hypothetical protein
MGVARLLAKGWLAFCLYAGALALARGLGAGQEPLRALLPVGIALFLFGSMGFLFIAGYGLSSAHAWSRLQATRLIPGFDDIVFIAFACIVFFMQVGYTPMHPLNRGLEALQAAVHFAIPGQRALEENLARCSLDSGRTFTAAIGWLLALIFLGSALSRIRMAGALVRLERKRHADPLGPLGVALVVGLAALVGIQFLFMGSLFLFLPCPALAGIFGDVLIGIAPLILAYLVFAAVTNLLAAGPEK